MIVAIPIGSFLRLIVALTVALVVIVMLLVSQGTHDTPGPNDVPSTVDIRAEQQ
jgi:hypothetical protein